MIAFVIAAAAYILGSLGYYTIAKRRGIDHAWLAWVPVINAWLLGCISDQYQSVTRGKIKNKRTTLLVLNIIATVLIVVVMVLVVAVLVQSWSVDYFLEDQLYADIYAGEIYVDDYYENFYTEEIPEGLMGSVMAMLFCYFVCMILGMVLAVVQYIALYDVFASCDPDNSVLYLLLSIFLGIAPFLVFACKDKDHGMPPKEPPVMPVYPGFYPQMPGQPPMYGQPPMPLQWSQPTVPPAPPAEPWEQDKE